jgi:putative Holliday junction resolvase
VFGLPYAIAGGNTPKTDETTAVLERLKSRLGVPITGWDERYSTSEAVEELKKLGYDWKRRREIQDAMAATLILKSYLENQ